MLQFGASGHGLKMAGITLCSKPCYRSYQSVIVVSLSTSEVSSMTILKGVRHNNKGVALSTIRCDNRSFGKQTSYIGIVPLQKTRASLGQEIPLVSTILRRSAQR